MAEEKIKMSFVSSETMSRDLEKKKRPRKGSELYDAVIKKVEKIKDRPLQLELTAKQRTGLTGKLKKLGLLATRKDPARPYQAKFKILERDQNAKPSKIRMYIYRTNGA